MKPKKPMKSHASIGKTSTPRSCGSGFERLEPSNMGFAMPEWMETSAEDLPSDGTQSESVWTAEAGLEPETRSVVEGMKVVCICKGIKKRVFWNALDAGMCTHEDINRHTGSGSGSCQGRRCGPRILDMLKRLR
jgi:bacterioferritin-associated ferredoxin